MRLHFLFLVAFLLPVACNSSTSEERPDKKFMKQVIEVAEEYVMGQLTNPQKEVSKNGLVTLYDSRKKYIIEPARIFTGLIDEDTNKDAIVSVSVYQGQYQTESEQLIILRKGKDYILANAMESDMRIISLKDRIITADVPEHSRNSPLFNCESCWEVVKYQFKTGELVRME